MHALQTRLRKEGRAVGIDFRFGGKIGSTLNSHRLLAWADKHHVQEQMVERLFSAYFEHERDLNDIEELSRIAAETGLDPAAAKAFLLSDELKTEVMNSINNWEARIESVPYFDFGRGIKFSGAQDEQFFVSTFQDLGFSQRINVAIKYA
eukprot:TRINITY_DN7835_c0_g1_i1.p1 TRINITY_DN7835_c0_g1~~TRINITY_DN7835_c0_g1_i1.p1  ORF type:complete len:150 (+),score=31.12 TRINITY_DN7835_c0_g1_i1:191-640(+)